MCIDFHAHAFTDTLAPRAIEKLDEVLRESGCAENYTPPATNGTAGDLLREMDDAGVQCSVILPIATKPSQQQTINNWAGSIMSDRLICFGTIHPDADDALEELVRIKKLGLKGVKLHPDEQFFVADEEKMFPVYEKCAELGLPVTLHAGFDASSPTKANCTPAMGANIIERVPDLTLIMAHLGGYGMWDDTEKYLAGKNVYLDTAYIAGNISEEKAMRIIKKHGADRILFASDCPWHSPKEEMAFINSLDLTREERNMIFVKNAERILGLNG